MGLQCRVGVIAKGFLSGDSMTSALVRDEALAEMIKGHTSNASTLELAMDAMKRISAAQCQNRLRNRHSRSTNVVAVTLDGQRRRGVFMPHLRRLQRHV